MTRPLIRAWFSNAGQSASSKSLNRRSKRRNGTTASSLSPFEGDLQDIRHLPRRAIEELEKFFEATDALETKTLTFKGWHGPGRATKTIRKASI
jgi:inorganic pyrophosphatase